MTTIRTSGLPADFRVKPWVQSFADEADRVTDVHSFGTYSGHQPSADLAVDCFVSPSNRGPGDALCVWVQHNVVRLGVDYIIFQRRIWNPEISLNWRPYSGPNPHTDHVHVSFNSTAPTTPGDDMPLSQDDLDKIKLLVQAEIKGVNERLDGGGDGDNIGKRVHRIEDKLGQGGGGSSGPRQGTWTTS